MSNRFGRSVRHSRVNMIKYLAVLVFAALATVVTTHETQAASIYWTDVNNGRILKSNLDGSAVQTVVSGQGYVFGIDIDASTGKMYWGSSGGLIRSANLDGTNVTTVVNTGSTWVFNLDVYAGIIYFNSSGSAGANGVGSVATNGTGLTRIAEDVRGEGIAYNPENGRIYYQTFDGFYPVRSKNADGTGPSSTVTVIPYGYNFYPGFAIDTVNDKLYLAGGNGSSITRRNLDGTGVETVLFPGGGYFPHSVELDMANNDLYYSASGTIGHANLDGTGNQTLYSSQNSIYDIALLLDAPADVPSSADVPEPISLALVGVGLVGLGFSRRRKNT